jgi:hypothetical protein
MTIDDAVQSEPENATQPGFLTQIAEDFRQGLEEGHLARKNPNPKGEYVHPVRRVSADRRDDSPIKAIWGLLDASDYRQYGDTQETADEGVLNPNSPHYKKSFINYDWS